MWIYFLVSVLADAFLAAVACAVLWMVVRRKTAALEALSIAKARLEARHAVGLILEERGRRPGNEEYLRIIFTTIATNILEGRPFSDEDDVELRKYVEQVVRLRISRGATELARKVDVPFVQCFCHGLARAVCEGTEADDKTATSLRQLYDDFTRGELKSPEKIADN